MAEPADIVWTLARVAALLNPYFDKDTPQGIREIEAEDWAEAIKEFPQWAIERACRWWKSADNPNRRKRPLEGDIVERIRREMEPVSTAKSRLDRGLPLSIVAPTSAEAQAIEAPRAALSPDAKARANALIAKAGFARRMPK